MARPKPNQRNSRAQTAKVRLNYYRSGQSSGSRSSPFEKRPLRAPSRSRKLLIGLIDIIVISVIIAGLVYALLIKSTPSVSLNSSDYHSQDTYKAAATNLFHELKNRNKITLNEQAIIRMLQKKFPEVSSGTVELPLFSETPTIRLNISPPAFVLKSQKNSYIVDRQGVAVAKSADYPSTRNLPLVLDQSTFAAGTGRQVISADAVTFIDTLLAQCRHARVAVASLSLPPRAQELDLVAQDQPYYVKFYLGGDPLVQTGQFLAARHQFDLSAVQPTEYLDVRVPGKIFYK